MQNLNYKDAMLCFRKAGNLRGVSKAQAELHAEAGRTLKGLGQTQESMSAFEAAKDIFLELNLIPKAALSLEAMDRIVEAACEFTIKLYEPY